MIPRDKTDESRARELRRSRRALLTWFCVLFLAVAAFAAGFWRVLRPRHHKRLAKLVDFDALQAELATLVAALDSSLPWKPALEEHIEHEAWNDAETLIGRLPRSDPQILLMHGLMLLRQGRPSAALVPLSEVEKVSEMRETASWCCVQALLLLGHASTAQAKLKDLEDSAPFGERARDLAGRIRRVLDQP